MDTNSNKEKLAKLAKYKREWRLKNPGKANEYNKKSYWNDPDKHRKWARAQYLKNPNRFKDSAIKWAKNNPEKRSAIMVFQNAKRRSRKKSNGGSGFNKSYWNELMHRFGNVCAYCENSESNSIDHFIPISKGGIDDYRNIVPSCKKCNSLKGSKMPEEWILNNFGIEKISKIKALMFS